MSATHLVPGGRTGRIVDHYEPVNLFALVSQLGSGFDASLRELDQVLDDDVIFQGCFRQCATEPRIPLCRGRDARSAL